MAVNKSKYYRKTHVMMQEDVNDAFGYHQHRNDMLDDREMSV